MLNGVGGKTIEEAKESITHDEFLDWIDYRNRHGSLNVARHLEWGIGLLAMILHNAHYKSQKKHSDFMPHYREPETTIEDVFSILVGAMR